VRFRTILVWNGFLPLAFVIYRTNGAMGCDDQGSIVPAAGRQAIFLRETEPRAARPERCPLSARAMPVRDCHRRAGHFALRDEPIAPAHYVP
jgi:hypothetical protein